MRNIIIILLLLPFISKSQTKWRQIERSLTKWNVPAAYDSIPGQTGYAGKWINLQTLIDTIGIGTGGNINGSGVTDYVAVWKSADTITGYPNFTFTGGNTVNVIGRMVLQATSSAGNWNAFINGGNTTLTGISNVAIGSNQTLSSLTTGNSNLAFGTLAGNKTSTGNENVFLGYLSGSENTTGNYNMYIGSGAGYLNNGAYNTYIGTNSGRNCLSTIGNIYLGYNTGYNSNNNYNIGIGYYNSFNSTNTGTENVIIGTQASQNGGGNYNIKIGTQSGYGNTGSNNVFIGQEAGFSTSSKGGNIFIGYEAGRNEDIDNSLIISNSASTSNGIYGDYDNAKFGVNIAPASAARTWDINGELRIRDLTTDNPTKLLGADNDGDVSGITLGSGLTLSGTTLSATSSGIDSTIVTDGYGINVTESPANTFTVSADTSKLVTQYDLSLVDQSETNEIQTIDTFQVFDTNKLRISLSSDGEPAKVVTLPTSGGGGGIDSTIVNGGWGIDVTEATPNEFTVKADTAEVATQYDLTLKQNILISGTNIKTVNSNSLLGSGNINVGTVTSIGTTAPISGGTITGSGSIGLNYDTGTLTLSGSNLAARAGAAIWNANQLQNTSIQSPLNPTTGNVLTFTASNQWEPKPPSNGTTNLTFTGGVSPFSLNSDTGTDVTFAAGSGISLTRSANELTIASTVTNPETWADIGGDVISWASTGTFNSGKQVGIGTLNAARLLDVNGDAQLRGAIYNSSSSAGSSGQVLTSGGTGAWTWATPADGSATNEAQTLSLSGGTISLSAVSGSGGGSVFIPSYAYGTLWNTGNLSSVTVDFTARKINFTSSDDEGTSASTANDEITISTTGVYKIEYNGTYQTQSPHVTSIYLEIYNNGSDIGYIGQCRTRNDENALNNLTNFSRSFITNLSAGDDLSLYYRKSTSNDTTCSFYNINGA